MAGSFLKSGAVLAGLLTTLWCVPAHANPFQELRRIRDWYAREVGPAGYRSTQWRNDVWYEGYARIVTVMLGGVPILKYPDLRVARPVVVAVTEKDETLPVAEERRIRASGERSINNGVWYRVEFGRGGQGWLFAHPDYERPIATAMVNPNAERARERKKEEEIFQKRLAKLRADMKPPVIGEKAFFFPSSERRIAGKEYARDAMLDIVQRNGNTVALVGHDGKIVVLSHEEITDNRLGIFGVIKWDTANNLATGLYYPSEIFSRYYRALTRALYGWFGVAVVFLFPIFVMGAGWELDHASKATWRIGHVVFIYSFLFFFAAVTVSLGTVCHESYRDFLRGIETYNAHLHATKTASGHVLPQNYEYVYKLIQHSSAAQILYVPLFVFVHLLIAGLGYPFFLWIAFLVIPHPATKPVTEALRSPSRPINIAALINAVALGVASVPATFVSRILRRKADALRERMRADKHLMQEAIQRERLRGELQKGSRP